MEGNSSGRQKGNIVTISGRDSMLQGAEETIAQQHQGIGEEMIFLDTHYNHTSE